MPITLTKPSVVHKHEQNTPPIGAIARLNWATKMSRRVDWLLNDIELCTQHIEEYNSAHAEAEKQFTELRAKLAMVKVPSDMMEEYAKRVKDDDMPEILQSAFQHSFLQAWERTINGQEIHWRFSILDKEKELKDISEQRQEACNIKSERESELRVIQGQLRCLIREVEHGTTSTVST